MQSILNLADSYKFSHSSQYPKNMVSQYDYMESRGGTYPATVFVGLQYYLFKYLTVPVTELEVKLTAAKAARHGVPFDLNGWMHIVNNCDGLIPVEIKAVPEGSLIPTKMVLVTIESTDTAVPWIAGFLETILMKIWYPTTIATKSYYTRKMLEKYGDPEWAKFAYHNFGDRGATSVESAAIGGFAHYTQFMGTDNFNSLDIAENYYATTAMPAYSVYATEHSSTTSHGREGEEEFVYTQLLENPGKAIMSFVADSYDVYEFTKFCTAPNSRIRELIESRPSQKLVLRPDSGNPIEVMTQMLAIVKANNWGYTETPTGLLFNQLGILWGDGITPEVIEEILAMVPRVGYAAGNFIFGSGGDLMQNITRDTQRFAIKCSSITVAHDEFIGNTSYEEVDVYKDPITDPGKASKRGKVTTYIREDGTYFVDLVTNKTPDAKNALTTVFLNGTVTKEYTLEEIRNNSKD